MHTSLKHKKNTHTEGIIQINTSLFYQEIATFTPVKPALKIHKLIYLSILLAFDQATLLNKDSLPNELLKFEINNVTMQSQSVPVSELIHFSNDT